MTESADRQPIPLTPPWTPAQATHEIRGIARSSNLSLSYGQHVRERLSERGLIISDVLHVLKNGFVYDEAQPATRAGYNKYCVENRAPNSGSRSLRVVVIPDKRGCELKLVTVMWADNKETAAGTIIGG